MAIYNHFNVVNGLLEALWIEGFETLGEAFAFNTENAGEDLSNAALGYRAFAHEHRGLYAMMFMHRFRNFQSSLLAAQVAV